MKVHSLSSEAGPDARLLSDLLHGLGQPVTSLRCSIELALAREQGMEDRHLTLRSALQLSEEISRYTSALRELMEIQTVDGLPGTSFLGSVLREVVEEFQPVANLANKRIALISSVDCGVGFHPERLHEALFHLVEFLLSATAEEGTVEITSQRNRDSVELLWQASPWSPPISDGRPDARAGPMASSYSRVGPAEL